MSQFVYKATRPNLVIENIGGAHLGRCYSAAYYKVVSKFPLGKDGLMHLRDAGFLGLGQEFYCFRIDSEKNKQPVPDTLDWRDTKVEATFKDVVQCVEVDDRTEEVINTAPINKYSGKPYGTTELEYYEYYCESRVDSGD